MFEVLGPVVARDGQTRIEITSPMQRAVLVTLLSRPNRAVTLADLKQALWGDESPLSAKASLHNQVLRLRRTLGPRLGPRLRTLRSGYVVDVLPSEIDEQVFLQFIAGGRTLAQRGDWYEAESGFDAALELWRGDPSSGLPATPPLVARSRRLHELRLEALEGRIQAGLEQGRHRELLAEIQNLADQHPMVESFHSALMLAQYRCGRRAEALAVFRRLRTMLAAELGVEPSGTVQDLHRRLLNADASLDVPVAATRAEHDVAESRSTAPRQLPADTRAFTGRGEEMNLLVKFAQESGSVPGAPLVCAIDGMGGIGKTTLAVHAAHRLAGDYPDGQLFLDLHGHTQGRTPRMPTEALSFLLRSLGVPPEQIPTDCEQAAALYRDRLAGTKTLIVLDNAATEAQVRPLLPASESCLVVVTSRRRLKALDDARPVSLEVLTPPDSITLLRAVVGTVRETADEPLLGEIAGLCGHLPLALRIAGAMLRHRPAWPLRHLADLLRDNHARVPALSDGERDLAAVFDLSYRSLDVGRRRLWRELSLSPGPELDAYAVAALTDLPLAAAADLLQGLVDHNLLSEVRPGRYQLHDLVRAYARDLTAADPEHDRETAVNRLLHYYAYTAQSASARTATHPRPQPAGPAPTESPAFPDQDTAVVWLRTELTNLDAAFGYAHTHGLDEHTVSLAAGLGEGLWNEGLVSQAVAVQRMAAEAAERAGRPVELAAALGDLGRVLNVTGEGAEAASVLRRAVEIHRALGDRRGEADVLSQLGMVQYFGAHYTAAADSLTAVLKIFTELDDSQGMASALKALARTQLAVGDLSDTSDALDRALEIYRALGNPRGEADTLNLLGRARLATGDPSGAAAANTRALEIYRALGGSIGEGYSLVELGRARSAAGEHREAASALTQALEIYRTLGDRRNEAWALNYYAATLVATGQRDRALSTYRQSLDMNRELNKPDDEATALEGLAECHLADGDTATAAALFGEASAIFQRLGMLPNERRVQSRLEKLASDPGQLIQWSFD